MKQIKPYILIFRANNQRKGYRDKLFQFDCDSESKAFKLLFYFRDNGNYFLEVHIHKVDRFGVMSEVNRGSMPLQVLTDLNKMSYLFFCLKYEIDIEGEVGKASMLINPEYRRPNNRG